MCVTMPLTWRLGAESQTIWKNKEETDDRVPPSMRWEDIVLTSAGEKTDASSSSSQARRCDLEIVSDQGTPFRLHGDLEVTSNARFVEIYVDRDDKETYLRTVRGVQGKRDETGDASKTDDAVRFHVRTAAPVSSIRRIRLRLLSIKPKGSHILRIRGLVVKERDDVDTSSGKKVVVEKDAERAEKTEPSSATFDTSSLQQMAMHMLAMSEKRVMEAVRVGFEKIEERMCSIERRVDMLERRG